MENQFDLQRYLSILRRRWAYIAIPAILIAIASLGFAYTAAPVYEASATILVESQQIPTDLASPTVTSDAAERIQVIQQRLLTRENLLQIAAKYALYQYLGTNLSPTDIIDNVRGAVSIDQIDSVRMGSSNRVLGFTVKFEYRDAATAARVTNELVTSILSQNVESRLDRASETSAFFEQQRTSLEQQLLELERRIAEFKRTNEADLPETLEIRRERLAQVSLAIEELNQQIREVTAANATGSIAAGGNGAKQLSFTLQAKQLELESVVQQRDELKPLAEKGFVPANRMRDLDREIAVTKLDIESIQSQIQSLGGVVGGEDALALLEEQKSELETQATALNESVLRTPLVQVQLNSLDRDYENLQSEYRQAQAKLENAQTGERLEQDRQSERFEVIEQATVPDTPTSPNRPRIMLAGVAGGLAAGVGLIIFRQLLDHSVYSAADIQRSLQLRPIAVVPYVVTKGEKRRRKAQLVLIIALVAALIAAALYAVHIFYLPLDLVAERLWDRAAGWLSARGIGT